MLMTLNNSFYFICFVFANEFSCHVFRFWWNEMPQRKVILCMCRPVLTIATSLRLSGVQQLQHCPSSLTRAVTKWLYSGLFPALGTCVTVKMKQKTDNLICDVKCSFWLLFFGFALLRIWDFCVCQEMCNDLCSLWYERRFRQPCDIAVQIYDATDLLRCKHFHVYIT